VARKGCFAASALLIPFGVVAVIMGVTTFVGHRRKEAVLTPAHRTFFTAARKGDLAGLRAGLAQGVDVNAHEPANDRTALMRAAAFDRPEAVKALLAARADPNAVDANRRTALQLAAEAGAAKVIPLLVAAGASADALSPDVVGERTPLGLAVRRGQVEAVRALLAAGANPDRAGERTGSPIEDAIFARQVDIVRALIAAKARLAPSAATGAAPSILHLAIGNCRPGAAEIVTMLVEAGADTQTRDTKGHTPLQAVEALDARLTDTECYAPIRSALQGTR
jgi:ankyrin repeat protein